MLDFFTLALLHCVKSVRIRNYCGPYFPAFVLNTETYGVSFHAVLVFVRNCRFILSYISAKDILVQGYNVNLTNVMFCFILLVSNQQFKTCHYHFTLTAYNVIWYVQKRTKTA